MKKNNSIGKEVKLAQKPWNGTPMIGMDTGDRTSRYCVVDGAGEVVWCATRRAQSAVGVDGGGDLLPFG